MSPTYAGVRLEKLGYDNLLLKCCRTISFCMAVNTAPNICEAKVSYHVLNAQVHFPLFESTCIEGAEEALKKQGSIRPQCKYRSANIIVSALAAC